VKTKKFGTLVLAGAMFASIAGCSGQPLTTREKGTLLGGAVGAGGGALVGAAVGAPGAGAAIGGAGGAVAGYAIGNHMQNQENSDYYYRH
jgi:osmotically inducible lipoprotein OsmB